jgi:hypothetical protein
MKSKMFSGLLMTVLLSSLAQAQSFELTNASISWGKGALTSGLDVTVDFTKSDSSQFFIINGNNERSNMNYGWNVTKSFAPVVSLGMFRNVPWIGLRGTYSPLSFVNFFHWSGLGFSKTKKLEEPGTNPNLFFVFNAVYVKVHDFRLGYGLNHFKQDLPNHLYSLKYSWPFNLYIKVALEVTYNYREEIPMFVMYLSYKF